MKICVNCKEIIKDESNFCPYCGTKISSMKKDTFTSRSSERYHDDYDRSLEINSYVPNQQKPKQSNVLKAIVIIVCVLVGGGILAGLFGDGETSKPTVEEPVSGELLSGMEIDDESEITVTSESDESCLVKLKTVGGATEMEFYVRAGDTVTVGVPYKPLYVYFASGKSWYGSEELFGEETDYSMDDTKCNFDEYTYTYTLYPVTDGNFSQTPIDADEF